MGRWLGRGLGLGGLAGMAAVPTSYSRGLVAASRHLRSVAAAAAAPCCMCEEWRDGCVAACGGEGGGAIHAGSVTGLCATARELPRGSLFSSMREGNVLPGDLFIPAWLRTCSACAALRSHCAWSRVPDRMPAACHNVIANRCVSRCTFVDHARRFVLDSTMLRAGHAVLGLCRRSFTDATAVLSVAPHAPRPPRSLLEPLDRVAPFILHCRNDLVCTPPFLRFCFCYGDGPA